MRLGTATSLLVGGGLILGARRLGDPSARDLGTALGAAVLGYGVWRLLRVPESAGAALKSEAALPSGAPGLTAADKVLGIFGRATDNEPPPGIEARADRGAVEGPHLGPPKNVLLVAGKIRHPTSGGELRVPMFADSVPIDAVVENQARQTREGTVRLRYLTDAGPQFVPGPRLTLAPGEMRQLQIRMPPLGVGNDKGDIALQFDGYTLETIGFRFARVIF